MPGMSKPQPLQSNTRKHVCIPACTYANARTREHANELESTLVKRFVRMPAGSEQHEGKCKGIVIMEGVA